MKLTINKIESISGVDSVVYLISDSKFLSTNFLSGSELKYIEKHRTRYDKELISLNRTSKIIFIQFIDKKAELPARLEKIRRSGEKVCSLLNNNKIKKINLYDTEGSVQETLALAEGIALSNYQFTTYRNKMADKEYNSLQQVNVFSKKIEEADIESLRVGVEATYKCRDLVNHPVSYLTAARLGEEAKKLGEEAGLKVEVFTKKKIESLKMGGLLAVNRGSVDPPSFTVMEWKPDNAKNEKPYLLVGKGVVYDTGGMNLKIQDHMNNMKSDMAGAAAVITTLYAVARLKLPVHVIGLVPATDNRVDGNAIVSGDVITMHDDTTVEVINTDAEGRLILADALSYAKKYKPEVVMNMATLTGSAQRATGRQGMVGMHQKAEMPFNRLVQSGYKVHERIAPFPFWDEYDEELKSDIADVKNMGGSNAGAITAGKFLARFTDYPFIHLDIAGVAFNEKKNTYQGVGGSGIGTRLFVDFLSGISSQ